MCKVNEESSTGGFGIPNPLSIKYEDEEYVKEVAKSFVKNLKNPADNMLINIINILVKNI